MWVTCQLGAREHYAIPRALESVGRLRALLTEAWVPSGSLWGLLRRNLRERYHAGVPAARVMACTGQAVGFEIRQKLRGYDGWAGILARNTWFQQQSRRWLEDLAKSGSREGARPTLFSFSYTAREPFRWAREQGWRTVLGQIDGGLGDEKHIAGVFRRHVGFHIGQASAPARYWHNWLEECELADTILVNSEWSRELLVGEGVPAEKIVVVPLAYSPPVESRALARDYPETFSKERPLRVLFLGQITVRKGVLELLEAARRLAGRPVEFLMVGPEVFSVPLDLKMLRNVRWFGAVPRGETAEFYRRADVFLFPTHSDGFGLTQLEAQAWKLPLIASPHCGRVVEPGRNGWLLPEVSAEAIEAALERCINEPATVAGWALEADDLTAYGIERLASRLLELP